MTYPSTLAAYWKCNRSDFVPIGEMEILLATPNELDSESYLLTVDEQLEGKIRGSVRLTEVSPNSINWTQSTESTIEFWFKPQYSGIFIYLDNTGAGNQYLVFALINDYYLNINFSEGTTSYSKPVTYDEWHHFALVLTSGSNPKVYIDGELTTSNSTHSFDTLFDGSTTMSFIGEFDEIRFWNEARTNTQIRQNMNGEFSPNDSHNPKITYVSNDSPKIIYVNSEIVSAVTKNDTIALEE